VLNAVVIVDEVDERVGENGATLTGWRPDVRTIAASADIAAEHAAMENSPDQSAPDDSLRYLMELAPQALAAYQVQRIVGQAGPGDAPHAFRSAAARAWIDNSIRAAGVGEFDESHRVLAFKQFPNLPLFTLRFTSVGS
jgi:hypothetical protein